jgi:hypothetical protein
MSLDQDLSIQSNKDQWLDNEPLSIKNREKSVRHLPFAQTEACITSRMENILFLKALKRLYDDRLQRNNNLLGAVTFLLGVVNC